MPRAQVRFGIPDVKIACATGARFNPADFAGHHLVVLFLPADESDALRLLREFESRAEDLVDSDCWLLAVAYDETPSIDVVAACPAIAIDPKRSAWNAFRVLVDRSKFPDRAEGGAFLFSRGGNLQRSWFGHVRADDVVQELHSESV